MGYGDVEILTNALEKAKGFDAIMHKYAGDKKFEYDEKLFSHSVLLRITIHEMNFKESGDWTAESGS